MNCNHNTMVETGNPEFVWRCVDCGYIYGKDTMFPKTVGEMRQFLAPFPDDVPLGVEADGCAGGVHVNKTTIEYSIKSESVDVDD